MVDLIQGEIRSHALISPSVRKKRGTFKNCEEFIRQCISTELKNTAIVNE